ncbi:MAG: B12-binding domain-containing radical SAM protein [Deltaproteobacteria bacterium]|nr:B12-binding domain-containing radical SAM protein [Deltaproteobacteria bacterium]
MLDITLIVPFTHTKNKINSVAIQILEKLCDEMHLQRRTIDIANEFIDCKTEMGEWFWKWVGEKLESNPSPLYAITTMNASFPWAARICEMIKKTNPSATVILGGPHVTALKEDIFKATSHVDYLCLYEAEAAFPDLVRYLRAERGEMPRNVIARKQAPVAPFKTTEKPQVSIGELPNQYYQRFTNLKIVDVEVGRGCPYDCYFCSSRELLGRTIRYKPIDQIINESNQVFSMLDGDRRFCLNYAHDNFLANKKYFSEFCAQKKLKKADFYYGCGARIDLIDYDILNQLISSGCKYLFIGVETGSARIQKICRKNLRLDTIIPKVKTLTNHGIFVEANFIMGFPEESLEDLHETIKLMIHLGSLSSRVNINFSFMSPERSTDIAKNTRIGDHILVEHTDYVKTLRKAGFNIEKEMNSIFNNHLYTIRHAQYDIIEKIHKGWDYVEFLHRYPFCSYFIAREMPNRVTNLFESMGDGQLDRILLQFFSAEQVENSTDIGYQMVRYEILLNNKSYFDKPVYRTFRYDIQNLYRKFLLNHDTLDMNALASEKRWHISLSGQ